MIGVSFCFDMCLFRKYGINIFSSSNKEVSMKNSKKEIRVLSKSELESVNGGLGFLAVLVPIAIFIAGCVTPPHKGDRHDEHHHSEY